MKALHPPSGSFMHLAAAAQSAGGVPHTHMSAAQLNFAQLPMPVKPSSDQKPAAGKGPLSYKLQNSAYAAVHSPNMNRFLYQESEQSGSLHGGE
jgi:hypothetical protein